MRAGSVREPRHPVGEDAGLARAGVGRGNPARLGRAGDGIWASIAAFTSRLPLARRRPTTRRAGRGGRSRRRTSAAPAGGGRRRPCPGPANWRRRRGSGPRRRRCRPRCSRGAAGVDAEHLEMGRGPGGQAREAARGGNSHFEVKLEIEVEIAPGRRLAGLVVVDREGAVRPDIDAVGLGGDREGEGGVLHRPAPGHLARAGGGAAAALALGVEEPARRAVEAPGPDRVDRGPRRGGIERGADGGAVGGLRRVVGREPVEGRGDEAVERVVDRRAAGEGVGLPSGGSRRLRPAGRRRRRSRRGRAPASRRG